MILLNPVAAAPIMAQEASAQDGVKQSPVDEDTGGLFGSVRSAEMAPITAATITLAEIGRMAITNGEGEFYLRELPSGAYAVEVEYLGLKYHTRATVTDGKLTIKHYRLDLTLAELEPLRVEATAQATTKMREFVRRQARDAGLFIGREEIDQLKPLTTGDLLYGRTGVDVEDDGLGDRRFNIGRGPGACRPNLFIDGSPVEVFGVDDYFPQHIEAVEVYESFLQTPQRYRSRNRCGAIIIWTRETFR